MPGIQRGRRPIGPSPGRCWALSTIKRVSLPGADELFRTTSLPKEESEQGAASRITELQPIRQPAKQPHSPASMRPTSTQRFIDKESKLQVPKQGSGRQRHEEKITFYCTREELLAIERARVALREFGIGGADRGRIVREALSY